MSGRAHDRRLDRLALLLIALAYGLICAKTLGAPLDGDEPRYLLMTHSLVHDGDFDLNDNFARQDYRAFVPAMGYEMVRPFPGGASYALHYVGLPLVLAPGYALAGRAGATATVAIASLAAAAGALRLARRWRPAGPAAPAALTALALSPPPLFHSSQLMPETVAAPIVAWALLAIVGLADCRAVEGARRLGAALAVGAGLALLAWLHPKFLVPVGVLGLVALAGWRARDDRLASLAALAAPLVASQVAMAALYQRWYGNPWPTGPRPTAPLGLAFLRDGLPGMLIDREYGLLVWAPIFGLALAALALALGRGQPLARPLAAVFLAVWVVNAANDAWWAGTSVPPRYLMPVLLPLAGPLALALADGAPARALAGGLASASLALALYGALLPGMDQLRARAVGQNALLARLSAAAPASALLGGRDLNDALPSFVRGPLDWATAADLRGETGRLVDDPAALGGQARAAEPGRDLPGYLTTDAPSWRFKGEVVATFRLRGGAVAPERAVARIEAWRREPGGGTRLAGREVAASDLAQGRFEPVLMRLVSPSAEAVVELRVYWYGAGALAVDDVRVSSE